MRHDERPAEEGARHARRIRLPGCPVHLSASEAPTAAPPLAGEHTAEVLGELLGLSLADVEELRAQGVLG